MKRHVVRYCSYLWIILAIVSSNLLAQDLKIVGVDVEDMSLQLRFNEKVSKDDFIPSLWNDSARSGYRYIFDINAQLTIKSQQFKLDNQTELRIAQNNAQRVRIVVVTPQMLTTNFKENGNKITLIFSKTNSIATLFSEAESKKVDNKNQPTNKTQKTTPTKTQKLTPAQQKINANSKRNIVIDPGHGGKDCGAQGVNRYCEKTAVLAIGKFLSEELKKRGFKVFMTRNSDVFISLRNRTKFANDKNADLFISIHSNAIAREQSKYSGIESYFLSTARSERAKKVAALENKDDIEAMNYFSQQSFLNTLNSHRIVASNRLAIDIQFAMLQSSRKLYSNIIDGGVREGPFWVLAGALMPSVLLEVGYITHPVEGKRLRQSRYQKALALGIANGIESYFDKNP